MVVGTISDPLIIASRHGMQMRRILLYEEFSHCIALLQEIYGNSLVHLTFAPLDRWERPQTRLGNLKNIEWAFDQIYRECIRYELWMKELCLMSTINTSILRDIDRWTIGLTILCKYPTDGAMSVDENGWGVYIAGPEPKDTSVQDLIDLDLLGFSWDEFYASWHKDQS